MSTQFTYPEGWRAELTLVVGYIPRWFACPHSHPSALTLTLTLPLTSTPNPTPNPTSALQHQYSPVSNFHQCGTENRIWLSEYALKIAPTINSRLLHPCKQLQTGKTYRIYAVRGICKDSIVVHSLKHAIQVYYTTLSKHILNSLRLSVSS